MTQLEKGHHTAKPGARVGKRQPAKALGETQDVKLDSYLFAKRV
jgi:hypothetical protein